jgi:hypothetical protein
MVQTDEMIAMPLAWLRVFDAAMQHVQNSGNDQVRTWQRAQKRQSSDHPLAGETSK